jgi:lipoprotein-releasing system permease protein
VLFGLFAGNLIGLGLVWLQKKYQFIKLDENSYYLDTAPVDLDFSQVLWLNLWTFCITLLFLIIPTFLVARISPLKAIRFE